MSKTIGACALLALLASSPGSYAQPKNVFLIQNQTGMTLRLEQTSPADNPLIRQLPAELKPNSSVTITGIHAGQPNGFHIAFSYQNPESGNSCRIGWDAYPFEGTLKYAISNIDYGTAIDCSITSSRGGAPGTQQRRTILTVSGTK